MWRERLAARAASAAAGAAGSVVPAHGGGAVSHGEPWHALERASSPEALLAQLGDVLDAAAATTPTLRSEQAVALLRAVATAAGRWWMAPSSAAVTRVHRITLVVAKVAVDIFAVLTQQQDLHLPQRALADVMPWLLRMARLQLPRPASDAVIPTWALAWPEERTVAGGVTWADATPTAYDHALAALVRLQAVRSLGSVVYANAERCLGVESEWAPAIQAVCLAHLAPWCDAPARTGAGTDLPAAGASASLERADPTRGSSDRGAATVDAMFAYVRRTSAIDRLLVAAADVAMPRPDVGADASGESSRLVMAVSPLPCLTSATILLGTALTRAPTATRNAASASERVRLAQVATNLAAWATTMLACDTPAAVDANGRTVSASFRLLHALLMSWGTDSSVADWLVARSEAVGCARALHLGITWGRAADVATAAAAAAASSLGAAAASASTRSPAGSVAASRRGQPRAGGARGGAVAAEGHGSPASSATALLAAAASAHRGAHHRGDAGATAASSWYSHSDSESESGSDGEGGMDGTRGIGAAMRVWSSRVESPRIARDDAAALRAAGISAAIATAPSPPPGLAGPGAHSAPGSWLAARAAARAAAAAGAAPEPPSPAPTPRGRGVAVTAPTAAGPTPIAAAAVGTATASAATALRAAADGAAVAAGAPKTSLGAHSTAEAAVSSLAASASAAAMAGAAATVWWELLPPLGAVVPLTLVQSTAAAHEGSSGGILADSLPLRGHGTSVISGAALTDRMEALDGHSVTSAGASTRLTTAVVPPSRTRIAIRARVTALHALTLLARHAPRALLSRWSLFIPEVQGTHPSPWSPSLTTVALYDASHRVREAAATALGTLLKATPLERWLPAEGSSSSSSSSAAPHHDTTSPSHSPMPSLTYGFGSNLGEKATAGLLETHAALTRALAACVPDAAHAGGEVWVTRRPGPLAALLQCTADVVTATPYARIGAHAAASSAAGGRPSRAAAPAAPTSRHAVNRSRIVRSLHQLAELVVACLSASNLHVCVSALHAVGAMMANHAAVAALAAPLATAATPAPSRLPTSTASPGVAGSRPLAFPAHLLLAVWRFALRCSGGAAAAAMRAEALSVVARSLRDVAAHVVDAWSADVAAGDTASPGTLASLLQASFLDSAPAVRASALRLMEELLGLRHGADGGDTADPPPHAALVGTLLQACLLTPTPGTGSEAPARVGALIETTLRHAVADPHATVRANALSCAAALTPRDWALAFAASTGDDVLGSPPAQLLLAMLRTCEDAVASVRSALARTMGVYLGQAEWRSPGFARTCLCVLGTLVSHDDGAAVRTKAAWALGNLVTPPNSGTLRSLAAALLGEAPPVKVVAVAAAARPPDAQAVVPTALDGNLLELLPRGRLDVLRGLLGAGLPGSGAGGDGIDVLAGALIPPSYYYRPHLSQAALVNLLSLSGVRALTTVLMAAASGDHEKVAGPAIRALGFCSQALILHWLPMPIAFRDAADPVITSETIEALPLAEAGSDAAPASRLLVRRPAVRPCPDDALIEAAVRQLASHIAAGQEALAATAADSASSLGDGDSAASRAGTAMPPAIGLEASKARWNACHAACLLLPLTHRIAVTHDHDATTPHALAMSGGSTYGAMGGGSMPHREGLAASSSVEDGGGTMGVGDAPHVIVPSARMEGDAMASPRSADALRMVSSGGHGSPLRNTIVTTMRHAAMMAGVQPSLAFAAPTPTAVPHSPPRPRVHKESVSGQATALAGVDHLSTALSPFVPKVRRAPAAAVVSALGSRPMGADDAEAAGHDSERPACDPLASLAAPGAATRVIRVVTDCTQPSAAISIAWVPSLLSALRAAAAVAPSTKVRIAATYALALVPSRRAFRVVAPTPSSPAPSASASAGATRSAAVATSPPRMLAAGAASAAPAAPRASGSDGMLEGDGDVFPPTLITLLTLWRRTFAVYAPAADTDAEAGALRRDTEPHRYSDQVTAALRIATMHALQIAERSDYARLKTSLDDAAAFLLQWLEYELGVCEGRTPATPLPPRRRRHHSFQRAQGAVCAGSHVRQPRQDHRRRPAAPLPAARPCGRGASAAGQRAAAAAAAGAGRSDADAAIGASGCEWRWRGRGCRCRCRDCRAGEPIGRERHGGRCRRRRCPPHRPHTGGCHG